MSSFSHLHTAARLLEKNGFEGFCESVQLIGAEATYALLVAQLRIRHSMSDRTPLASAEIEEIINNRIRNALPDLAIAIGEGCELFYTPWSYVFDNFSAHAISWNGRLWPTVEHAYQAAKFHKQEIVDRIIRATSPGEAKKIAHERHLVDSVRLDWEAVKIFIMKELLRTKAEQHELVRRRLAASKGKILIEDSSSDSFWGRGRDWRGNNMLGKLWMEVRDEMFPGFVVPKL